MYRKDTVTLTKDGLGEMGQWLRALATPVEDSSTFRFQYPQSAASQPWNYSSGALSTLPRPPQAPMGLAKKVTVRQREELRDVPNRFCLKGSHRVQCQ